MFQQQPMNSDFNDQTDFVEWGSCRSAALRESKRIQSVDRLGSDEGPMEKPLEETIPHACVQNGSVSRERPATAINEANHDLSDERPRQFMPSISTRRIT